MKLDVRFELRLLPRGEGDRTEVVREPAGRGRVRPAIALSSHLGARAALFEESFSAVLETSLGAASRQTNNVRLGCDV